MPTVQINKKVFFMFLNPIELHVPDVTGMCNLTQIIQSLQKDTFIWATTLKFSGYAE